MNEHPYQNLTFKEKAIRFLNVDLNDWLFYIAYILYLVIALLRESSYPSTFPNMPINKLLMLSILLLMLKAFLNTMTRTEERVGICIAFGILVWINFAIGDVVTNDVTWIVIFIISARDIEFRKIARISIVVGSIMLAFIIFSALSGIIPNRVMGVIRIRYFLGFNYPSLAPTLLFNITALLVYIHRNQIKFWQMAVLLGIDILLFIITDSRNPFILVCIALAAVIILRYKPDLFDNSKVAGWLLVLSAVICTVISLYLVTTYDPTKTWMSNLDGTLSGRLRLSHQSIQQRGVRLFPRPFPQSENGVNYPYVDCTYLYVLQEYGVILSTAFLGFMTYGFYKIWKQKEYYLLIVLTFMCINAMIDRNLMRLVYNTFWLVLGAALFAKDTDDDLLTSKTQHIPMAQINAMLNNYGASVPQQKPAYHREAPQATVYNKTQPLNYKYQNDTHRHNTDNTQQDAREKAEASAVARELLRRRQEKAASDEMAHHTNNNTNNESIFNRHKDTSRHTRRYK